MNDRELLELAARAVGISIWKHGKTDGAFINGRAESWSPLTNDGDAFRLMVILGLIVKTGEVTGVRVWNINHEIYEPCEGDRLVTVRRAIVRAAARIGEGRA